MYRAHWIVSHDVLATCDEMNVSCGFSERHFVWLTRGAAALASRNRPLRVFGSNSFPIVWPQGILREDTHRPAESQGTGFGLAAAVFGFQRR